MIRTGDTFLDALQGAIQHMANTPMRAFDGPFAKAPDPSGQINPITYPSHRL